MGAGTTTGLLVEVEVDGAPPGVVGGSDGGVVTGAGREGVVLKKEGKSALL